MQKILSLEEFIRNYNFFGDWEVAYTDNTHLKVDEYLPLGKISVPFNPPEVELVKAPETAELAKVAETTGTANTGEAVELEEATVEEEKEETESPVFLPFSFYPVKSDDLRNKIKENDTNRNDNRVQDCVRKIFEALEESSVRCGLTKLKFQIKTVNSNSVTTSIDDLAKLKYVIIVTDTGAIKRGIISTLLRMLPETVLWTIIPVQVLYEVQSKAENFKNSQSSEPKIDKCKVNERPIITAIAREIEAIKTSTPVEILNVPGNVLKTNDSWQNDRLIIETAKGLRQSRSLTKEVFLATGDKIVFSLACLEELNAIYVRQLPLEEENWSFSFNTYAGKKEAQFSIASIHNFLWDLTGSFSTIKLTNDEGRGYKLNYYFEGKLGTTPDTLRIEEILPEVKVEADEIIQVTDKIGEAPDKS